METRLPCGITLKLVESEQDVYIDMALTMLDRIIACGQEGRPCAMIVPVGPTGQYPILAELVNRLRVDLHHVTFFNMDEYLTDPQTVIPPDHPMSFHHRMETEFYSRVDPQLVMPPSQRLFPVPGRECEYDDALAALGGAELCLGGLGINGHIAFNEPPEPGESVSPEAFAQLGTRVLPISRETRTVNAIGYQRGDIRGMPEYCITIGMKPILAARRIYIALNREWQHGIARHVLRDEPTAAIPASLLQMHGDVRFCAPRSIGEEL